MSYSSLRTRDSFVEKELAKFLDKYLYSDSSIFANVRRIDNDEQQIQGVDIIVSIPKLKFENLLIDEKAQLRTDYIGNPLPTFVLELTFLNSINNIQEGWFLRDDLSTSHYLLIWIDEVSGDTFMLKEEYINKINFCLVNKQKLKDYFVSNGYTKQALIQKSNLIRQAQQSGPIDKFQGAPFYFFYTTGLPEKPINIVVKKNVYLSLADLSGTITRIGKDKCIINTTPII